MNCLISRGGLVVADWFWLKNQRSFETAYQQIMLQPLATCPDKYRKRLSFLVCIIPIKDMRFCAPSGVQAIMYAMTASFVYAITTWPEFNLHFALVTSFRKALTDLFHVSITNSVSWWSIKGANFYVVLKRLYQSVPQTFPFFFFSPWYRGSVLLKLSP